jgi:hypothetical protein
MLIERWFADHQEAEHIAASVSQTLGAAACSSLAAVEISASADPALDAIALSSSGTVVPSVSASLDAACDDATLASEGTVVTTGSEETSRPFATMEEGDWVTASGSLHGALSDESDSTYIRSLASTGATRTIELLEGEAVRAMRTLEGTDEPSEYALTLTAPEMSSFTDWKDLRVRLTDGNGAPGVFALGSAAEPPSGAVQILIRMWI